MAKLPELGCGAEAVVVTCVVSLESACLNSVRFQCGGEKNIGTFNMSFTYIYVAVVFGISSKMMHTSSASNCASGGDKFITLDSMNENVKTMEYAVRGPLVIRATEIEKEIASVMHRIKNDVFKYYAVVKIL